MITFPTLLAKMTGNTDYALPASDYSASTKETAERAETASTLSSASSSKCWSTSKILVMVWSTCDWGIVSLV